MGNLRGRPQRPLPVRHAEHLLVEQAAGVEYGLAHEQGGGIHQRFAAQHLPQRIGSRRPELRLLLQWLPRLVHHGKMAVSQPHLRVFLQRRHLPLQLLRPPQVVLIQQRNVLPLRRLNARVARHRGSPVRRGQPNQPRLRGEPIPADALLARSVVHDEDFEVRKRLPDHALQSLVHIVRRPIGWNDDRDTGHGHEFRISGLRSCYPAPSWMYYIIATSMTSWSRVGFRPPHPRPPAGILLVWGNCHDGIKRAYGPPSPDDGERVLVERLWPRGLTKKRAAIDLWLRDLAPSTVLRKWFGHDPDKWSEFRRRYLQGTGGRTGAKCVEGAPGNGGERKRNAGLFRARRRPQLRGGAPGVSAAPRPAPRRLAAFAREHA